MTKKKEENDSDKLLYNISTYFILGAIISLIIQVSFLSYECIEWEDTYPEDLYILTDFEKNGGEIYKPTKNSYIFNFETEEIKKYSIYRPYFFGEYEYEKKYYILSNDFGLIELTEGLYDYLKDCSTEFHEPTKVCTKSMLVRHYD